MLIITIAIYIVILLIIWGFFAVARMHTMKFKNFSTHIVPVTNYLMILLIILSISGLILIFNINSGNNQFQLTTNEDIFEEKGPSYENDIVGDNYY